MLALHPQPLTLTFTIGEFARISFGIWVSVCCLLFAVAASAAEPLSAEPLSAEPMTTASGVLVVTLSGMKSDDGSLVYAMWSGPEGWLETNTVRDGSVPIVEGQSEIRFDGLPYGEYAISVYHDRNANMKLDTGLFRMPKEPLGTSNDARIRFGPPRYEDAVFKLDQPELRIHIPVRKLFD